jgi:hypothetical protein
MAARAADTAAEPVRHGADRLVDKLGDNGLLARPTGSRAAPAGDASWGLTPLLDRFGDRPAVVDALRELRVRTPFPAGPQEHLPAVTDATSLPSLGGDINLLPVELHGAFRPATEDALLHGARRLARADDAGPTGTVMTGLP